MKSKVIFAAAPTQATLSMHASLQQPGHSFYVVGKSDGLCHSLQLRRRVTHRYRKPNHACLLLLQARSDFTVDETYRFLGRLLSVKEAACLLVDHR